MAASRVFPDAPSVSMVDSLSLPEVPLTLPEIRHQSWKAQHHSFTNAAREVQRHPFDGKVASYWFSRLTTFFHLLRAYAVDSADRVMLLSMVVDQKLQRRHRLTLQHTFPQWLETLSNSFRQLLPTPHALHRQLHELIQGTDSVQRFHERLMDLHALDPDTLSMTLITSQFLNGLDDVYKIPLSTHFHSHGDITSLLQMAMNQPSELVILERRPVYLAPS